MEYQKMTQQMLHLNKTAFDNSFNAMNMACEQNRKMAESFLSKAEWIPEEGRQAYREWMTTVCNGANDFKEMVEENYSKVASYFNGE